MDAMLPPPRELAGRLAIPLIVLFQFLLWVSWLLGWASHRRGISTFNAVGYALFTTALVVVLAQAVRALELQPSKVMLFFLVVLSELLWYFARLYWDYGTVRNFTPPWARGPSIQRVTPPALCKPVRWRSASRSLFLLSAQSLLYITPPHVVSGLADSRG